MAHVSVKVLQVLVFQQLLDVHTTVIMDNISMQLLNLASIALVRILTADYVILRNALRVN